MARQEFGDARVAAVGEIGGFPRVGVRFSKRRRVTVADVVHRVYPREVRVEGGTIIHGGGRGWGFANRLEGRWGRGPG